MMAADWRGNGLHLRSPRHHDARTSDVIALENSRTRHRTRRRAVSEPSVLIAGVGIAGPTLAYWLHRFGFRPTLVEHAPRFGRAAT